MPYEYVAFRPYRLWEEVGKPEEQRLLDGRPWAEYFWLRAEVAFAGTLRQCL